MTPAEARAVLAARVEFDADSLAWGCPACGSSVADGDRARHLRAHEVVAGRGNLPGVGNFAGADKKAGQRVARRAKDRATVRRLGDPPVEVQARAERAARLTAEARELIGALDAELHASGRPAASVRPTSAPEGSAEAAGGGR